MTLEPPADDLCRMLRDALTDRNERTDRDGPQTVTGFLEALTGESLVADVMSQRPATADLDDGLAVDAEQTVIRRVAKLRGRGGTPYLYAETAFVPARLPPGARHRLAHGSDPIGRVVVDEGLFPARLPALRPVPRRCPEPVEPEVAAAVVWRRGYRLALGGRPVFAIREWFLHSVLVAIAAARERPAAQPSRSSSF